MKNFSREAKQRYLVEHSAELNDESFNKFYDFFHALIKAQEKKAQAETYVKKIRNSKKDCCY